MATAATDCAHRYLELWGKQWHCGCCKALVEDDARVLQERECAERAENEDAKNFGGGDACAARGTDLHRRTTRGHIF